MSFLVYIFGIVCFVILFKKYLRFKRFQDVINKIPGPPTLPFIGNAHCFFGSPEEMFQKRTEIAKLYKPEIIRFWLGPFATVNLYNAEDVEVLISTTKNHEKSLIYTVLRPWLGDGLLTSKGSKWQVRRKILTPSFHFNILQQFLAVFVEKTNVLVDKLKNNKQDVINVVEPITKFTLHSICETAMGISVSNTEQEQKSYHEATLEIGRVSTYRVQHPWLLYDKIFFFTRGYRRFHELCKKLHSFSRRVIQDREAIFKAKISNGATPVDNIYSTSKKRMAMLDVLLSAKINDRNIDDEGIREEVDTFMFEGHDTTAVSICFTLMLLACNKECQEKVYEEIIEIFGDSNRDPTYNDLNELKYMDRCIKESLRLYPSVPFISRITSGENKLPSGYTVPDKTVVSVHIYNMHRKAEYFPDPEKFDPDRFLPENIQTRHPFVYIPFSAGPRNCIGQKFAVLQIKTVLVGILKHFILEPVDTPETIVLINDIVLRTKNGIKVRFVSREQPINI